MPYWDLDKSLSLNVYLHCKFKIVLVACSSSGDVFAYLFCLCVGAEKDTACPGRLVSSTLFIYPFYILSIGLVKHVLGRRCVVQAT
jgi:hypothetical protein